MQEWSVELKEDEIIELSQMLQFEENESGGLYIYDEKFVDNIGGLKVEVFSCFF